jgi:pilus assembly protein Flp/PilA
MLIAMPIVSRVHRAACWLRSARGRDDDERGQGMVEYALILVLVTIVVIVILGTLGHTVNNVFSNVNAGIAA